MWFGPPMRTLINHNGWWGFFFRRNSRILASIAFLLIAFVTDLGNESDWLDGQLVRAKTSITVTSLPSKLDVASNQILMISTAYAVDDRASHPACANHPWRHACWHCVDWRCRQTAFGKIWTRGWIDQTIHQFITGNSESVPAWLAYENKPANTDQNNSGNAVNALAQNGRIEHFWHTIKHQCQRQIAKKWHQGR